MSARAEAESGDVAALIAEKLPGLAVERAPERRASLAADIAGPAPAVPAAVVSPASHDEVVRLVELVARHAIPLHPKGGGWSYTGGFATQSPRAVLVDTTRLGGITIAADRRSVTAGAGVTWAALYDALDAQGLRAESFGPLSGMGATLGGLAAQNGGFFGAARYGLIGDGTLTGARMVDGRGETHDLSSADRVDGGLAPQPLAGDGGAFGIKTALTLRLVERPSPVRFASFAFEEAGQPLALLAAISGREGLGEAFLFDPVTHANLAATGFSLSEAAGIAGDLAAARGSIADRLGGLVRAGLTGTGFVKALRWSLHVSTEGPAADDALSEITRRARAAGGREIPDTIPRVTRARPFRRIKALLGPAGELWLPLHGTCAPATIGSLEAALAAALAEAAPELTRHRIRVSTMAVAIGPRIVIEPQIFWPDALQDVHRRLAQPDQIARYAKAPANPEARALVCDLRRRLIDVLDGAGAAHFQVGRSYAANPGVAPETLRQWRVLKSRFDPANIMNPGVLGL